MEISQIIRELEALAPLSYQEDYDNAGLIAGDRNWSTTGVLVSLDVTEAVVREAAQKKCNLIVSHHPLIFRGLKRITGQNDVEKALILAIKSDIALYAIHTNLDNVEGGVNGEMADRLGLTNRRILLPKKSAFRKLYTFVPHAFLETVRKALFQAGAGRIGHYSEVSFSNEGTGTFQAGAGANPFVGHLGQTHHEPEAKLEVIFPAYLQDAVIQSLIKTHPYEEVAYDIVELSNSASGIGSGMVGELEMPMDESAFLEKIKRTFNLSLIRHTPLLGRPVRKVALCGGTGSFLIYNALAASADFFITADLKYHEFFCAGNSLVMADIGHFESEQFTSDLLCRILQEKFPTFAVLKSTVKTNPVHYFS